MLLLYEYLHCQRPSVCARNEKNLH
ncbi:hypothetical protein FHW11_001712 [Pantoea agglomerans]|nr:hypothetical protein [Pantoea agglomerans]MBA8870360.1 hypothetical protein [Pantoea agglomerans]MBA8891977.1 hypothetical protein [Pantoea agglomerans]MDQ0434481.1 hypothetical protein [Pantoea agglomerans]